MLIENASQKISRYNQFCLHYNLVANAIYQELRRSRAPLSLAYEPFLVAALISFDMGRMMGEGIIQRYDTTANGFAARLHKKLREVESILAPFIHLDIFVGNMDELSSAIKDAYEKLSAGGQDGLHEQGNEFHVGATKLLHFLNPEMFMIVDRNTARAIRDAFAVPYKNSTQPGYSGKYYVQSLNATKKMMVGYGAERFRSLEPGTPVMRIFDKIAFAHSAFGM